MINKWSDIRKPFLSPIFRSHPPALRLADLAGQIPYPPQWCSVASPRYSHVNMHIFSGSARANTWKHILLKKWSYNFDQFDASANIASLNCCSKSIAAYTIFYSTSFLRKLSKQRCEAPPSSKEKQHHVRSCKSKKQQLRMTKSLPSGNNLLWKIACAISKSAT